MSTSAKVSAREKARAKMAEQREAQRARELATEKDLATLLSADDGIAKARDTQDAAVARAQAVYDKACAAAREAFESATATARADQAAAAHAMKQRGDTIATIAALAEMSARDVTALIKTHTTTPPDTQPGRGDGDSATDTTSPTPATSDDARPVGEALGGSDRDDTDSVAAGHPLVDAGVGA